VVEFARRLLGKSFMPANLLTVPIFDSTLFLPKQGYGLKPELD